MKGSYAQGNNRGAIPIIRRESLKQNRKQESIFKAFQSQEGFNLIELLVVIAILGVLAAVVIPTVTLFIGEGEDESAQTELHNMQVVVTSVMADPSVPIQKLTLDPRVISFTQCDPAWIGINDASVPVTGEHTYGVNDPITLLNIDTTVMLGTTDTDTMAKEITSYMNKTNMEHWYCLEEDGKTHGWLASTGEYIAGLPRKL